MMEIYHGSLEMVECPEIRVSGRTLDYGHGFYTTTSREQARRWVQRKIRENKAESGYVNAYDFDLDAAGRLKMLSFDKPSEDWVDFVMKNRTQVNFNHDYDIVYGPVANDRVYASFALFEGGIISKQTLIAELKTYVLVDQYLFHTPKSLGCIRFKEAEEIRP